MMAKGVEWTATSAIAHEAGGDGAREPHETNGEESWSPNWWATTKSVAPAPGPA